MGLILGGRAFHVKHSPLPAFSFQEEINRAVDSFGAVKIKVDSFSLIPFLLSSLGFPSLVVCQKGFFDDVFGSFPVGSFGCVGVPFVRAQKNKSLTIGSYYQDLLARSSAALSSRPLSVDFCVVDERSVDIPFVSSSSAESFLLDEKSSYDSFLSFLTNNGYTKKDAVEGPGDFVLRGGVVDVFSFGLPLPFRLCFWGNKRDLLFFEIVSGKIIKKESSCFVFPYQKTKNKTIRSLDCFGRFVYVFKDYLVVSRKKDTMKARFSLGPFSVLSYQKYRESGVVFSAPIFSKKLLIDGCLYKKSIFLPEWFSNEVSSKKQEYVPLSGTLNVGDFFVHESYGVCKYLGLSPSDADVGEKIILQFVDGKIYLDVRFMNQLSFFKSRNQEASLDSLNKKGVWMRRKKASQKKAEEFIFSVVRSYLKREGVAGPALNIDFDLISLFLSEFPFVDTEDQASAWKDIIRDFSSGSPMHRLICGDVGFGKTELAMRAAFLVCSNNKQVVVLAPTTILCKQLYSSFKQRLSPFGFSVEQHSRLSRENSKTLCSFYNKKIDILIATHGIINNKKALSSASLVVVDEEHRFGVDQKERVFHVSPGCHFLSMSATPIPRTMQFSLSGIRSISSLLSPPKSRKPIITNAYYYNKGLFLSAISFEIGRGGQVFVVDSSVNNVKSLGVFLKKEFPSFSIDVLYASQNKKIINSTMEFFRSKKTQILISTVIIESGIDIPSANTIIINNSHLFGLSQLHQLRGRVGRSSCQSYAYLFVPKNKKINPSGLERIKAIKSFSALGSGYGLALRDLEIRGSGSLFGHSQSGSGYVGFEHYSKMLSAAIKKMKNNDQKIFAAEVLIEEAFIPPSFIPIDGERSFYYKSISETNSLPELDSLLLKTKNLFGSLPRPFLALFLSKRISLLSESSPILKILSFESFLFVFVSLSDVEDLPSFLKKLDLFFEKRSLHYIIKTENSFLKIQFKYIKDDCYILLENLIKHLSV